MADELDDLYGESVLKEQEPSSSTHPATTTATEEDDVDDAPYEPPDDEDDGPAAVDPVDPQIPADAGAIIEPDDDEEDDEDSDDDIEIVMDAGAPSAAPLPSVAPSAPTPSSQQTAASGVPSAVVAAASAPVVKPSPITRTQVKVGQAIPRQDGTLAPPVKPPVIQKAVVDVDEIGTFDGSELYNVDLETLEDKPWRRPGADITDFFNYGFTEQTWKMYCDKQKGVRVEFPQQVPPSKDLGHLQFQQQQQQALHVQHQIQMQMQMQHPHAGVPLPPFPGMRGQPQQQPQQTGYEVGRKRGREDEGGNDMGGSDDRQMRDPRYYPEGYGNPDFGVAASGGPTQPPMGMYGGGAPDGYGHMPPQGYMDPYQRGGGVGGGPPPMPARGSAAPSRNAMMPARPTQPQMRGGPDGGRPGFYPMDMDPQYRGSPGGGGSGYPPNPRDASRPPPGYGRDSR
ncbi:Vacuolar protein-sorting-associated protein 36 [Thoreauomyces humboldtii]|nr:Vacuolar protein-sorting-associated protein 36 [Thoreauomyces humboldtii]